MQNNKERSVFFNTRSVNILTGYTILTLLVIGFFLYYFSDILRLQIYGVDALATVTSKEQKLRGSSRYSVSTKYVHYLQYEFAADDDTQIVGSAFATTKTHDNINEGDKINIQYLVGKPQVNSIVSEVEGFIYFCYYAWLFLTVLFVLMYVSEYMTNKAMLRLLKEGKRISAKITLIEQIADSAGKYQITSEFTGPDKKLLTHRSNIVSKEDIKGLKVGDKIEIAYDTKYPESNMWVDEPW